MKITVIILGVLIAVSVITCSIREERQKIRFMSYCHGTLEQGMEENTVLIFWKHHENICSDHFDRHRQGKNTEMVRKWEGKYGNGNRN